MTDFLCSQTDTADEKSDSEDGPQDSSAEAAKALLHLAGGREAGSSPLKSMAVNGRLKAETDSLHGGDKSLDRQHSPVLMEHSYCLPWAQKQNPEMNHVAEGEQDLFPKIFFIF